VASLLVATPSDAEIEHRQFSELNYMYKVANDDWQPEGFDTGRVVPAVYYPSPEIKMDGRDDESAWGAAKDVLVNLQYGNVAEASVKALYTDDDVFIRVRWADASQDREHRPWVWDTGKESYVPGPQIEDSLLVSFEAGCEWNSTILAGYPFDFDGWHWLAARSDPVGQAWDIIGNMSRVREGDIEVYDSRPRESKWILKFTDKYQTSEMNHLPWQELDRSYMRWPVFPKVTVTRHLDRMTTEDASVRLPAPDGPPQGEETVFPSIKAVSVDGGAGEVAAKGHWENGYWTVEFRRSRMTPDKSINDVMFNRLTQFGLYIFDGVERFDEASESERLYLQFARPETQLVSN
jgi:hypothetical protein